MANGTLKVSNIETSSGSGTITLGQSGETLSVPSGVTLDMSSGTMTLNSDMKNTPSFLAYRSSSQTISQNTQTKIAFNTEKYDTTAVYDASTNYRFTPGVAGKYLIFGQVMMESMPDQNEIITYIYKNDTNYAFSRMKCSGTGSNSNMIQILDTANTTDYYDIRMYQSASSSKDAQGSNTFRTFFGANKIIE